MISDSKCQELWTLLQEVRRVDTLTNQDMIRYRRECERHVGSDEHLYRVEWVSGSNQMCVMSVAVSKVTAPTGYTG